MGEQNRVPAEGYTQRTGTQRKPGIEEHVGVAGDQRTRKRVSKRTGIQAVKQEKKTSKGYRNKTTGKQ